MFSGLFKSKKKDQKDKEISLVVERAPPQEPFVGKVAKSLLVRHSPVFKKMGEKGDFKKSRQIKLKGITATGLHKMIEYMTTETVFFQNHFEVIETLKAAHVYEVSAVSDLCSNFLTTAIERTNVCDIYEFALDYSFHQVEFHCLRFIDRHAGDVLHSAGFLTLKKATVQDIVKRQSLDVPTEVVLYRAILTWGLNDCLRRGDDIENPEEVLKSIKSLLTHVRFASMSEEELSDPEVQKFYKLLHKDADCCRYRSRSFSRSDSSRSGESISLHRDHTTHYDHDLETVECDVHPVRNGESFCLRLEVLKGRVFLTGVGLAFDKFVRYRGNSCLYVAVSATNVDTTDQVSARGTFMTTEEEAIVEFPSPLVVRESQTVEMAMNVKRAVNICSMLLKSESQIAVSDRKDVAIKIVPPSTAGGTERSMFKSLKYFY